MTDIVRLKNFLDRFSAEMAKSVLDENDIVSYVVADDAGGYRPQLLASGEGAWIVVRAEDAERAALLLEDGVVDLDELEREAMSFAPPADA